MFLEKRQEFGDSRAYKEGGSQINWLDGLSPCILLLHGAFKSTMQRRLPTSPAGPSSLEKVCLWLAKALLILPHSTTACRPIQD